MTFTPIERKPRPTLRANGVMRLRAEATPHYGTRITPLDAPGGRTVPEARAFSDGAPDPVPPLPAPPAGFPLGANKAARHKAAREATHALLRERWPAAFAKPVPLKVGIHHDIRAALPAIDVKALRDFLCGWTQRGAYRWALRLAGARRVDLAGQDAGPAFDLEREAAATVLSTNCGRQDGR